MKPLFDLSGKTAVVTGGGSGIGQSISLLFASQGAQVAIVDVDQEKGEAVQSKIEKTGGTAFFHHCNIAEQREVLEAFVQCCR